MDFAALAPLLGSVQKAMAQANTERKAASFTGKAGGGALAITLTGELTVAKVQVAPAAAHGDPAMLEDLITAALGDALRQHRERFGGSPEEQLQKIMAKGGGSGGGSGGGLLGGLFGR